MPNALILLKLLMKATVHLVARFSRTFHFVMSQSMFSECTGGNVYPPKNGKQKQCINAWCECSTGKILLLSWVKDSYAQPRALHMLGRQSITKLPPAPLTFFTYTFILSCRDRDKYCKLALLIHPHSVTVSYSFL